MGNSSQKQPSDAASSGSFTRPGGIREALGLPRSIRGNPWYVYAYWGLALVGIGVIFERKINGEFPEQKFVYEKVNVIPNELLTPEVVQKLKERREEIRAKKAETVKLLIGVDNHNENNNFDLTKEINTESDQIDVNKH